MSIVSEFRNWLSGFPNEPKERMALAHAALNAFSAARRRKRVSATDLESLVAAASSPHKLVFETGCKLLRELAKTKKEAQECFLTMARSKSSTARFHAVAYLGLHLPEPLRTEIVRLALRDSSAKVRQMAIDRAESFKFVSLLPQLQALQRTETDKTVQQTLALCIPLLRDGYVLEPTPDGSGYYLTVSRRGATGGPYIPKEKCTRKFVQEEIRRLRREEY
jgi:hypothetical protein